jgi:hypothetical protein
MGIDKVEKEFLAIWRAIIVFERIKAQQKAVNDRHMALWSFSNIEVWTLFITGSFTVVLPEAIDLFIGDLPTALRRRECIMCI